MLKEDGPDSVYSAVADPAGLPREIVVKIHESRSLKDRFRAWTGSTRLRRQRLGAQLLQRAGVATAAPLAAGVGTNSNGECEWLVLESVPGKTLLAALDQASPDQAASLARTLGELIRRMLMSPSPVFNRDQKPSNIIVADGGFVIVDTVGVRALSSMPRERAAARMVASALIEPAGCEVRLPKTFAANILAGIGTQPQGGPNPFDSVALARVATMVSAILREHGDPTPRINPLQ